LNGVLRELHISNLAVIADARIEFAAGLNCFTGTTGAGKSLVIGAIELLLGLRTPADMLRAGVAEARVSGVFEINSKPLLAELETIADAPLSNDGGELLLTRRIFASGRSSITLNGNPITLAMLKQMAEAMIDVHGQHDHQFLLKPSNQLAVLDEFGQCLPLRTKYQSVWHQLVDARQRLAELSSGRSLRQQQLELYRFQLQEIDAAELQPGEYEELTARASVLQNLEKLKKDATAVQAALYEADGSILERLKGMTAVLAEAAGLDASIATIGTTVRDATIQLEEAAFDLSRYLGKLELDPAELAEVNDRLNTVNRLVKKYGDSVDAVLQYREQIAAETAQLERQSDDLSGLNSVIEPLERELTEIGQELTEKRRAAARKLGPLIDRQLSELGMDKAVFTIQLSRDDENATPSGFDSVEYIVQTNPGQAAQPLRKIASGGELSRVMLALKSVLAAGERVSVLVFDEIDSNVGGRLGAIIGTKLRDLARHHQVLCITHLPQIAAYADRHLTVRKSSSGKSTETTVREMTGSERVEELAEMIGGQQITSTTRAQAQELLDAAAAPKTKAPKSKQLSRQ
jgi:DNA repair protein RecN (Recombination protein N)